MRLNDVKNKIAIKLIALIILSLVVSTLTFLLLAHQLSNYFWIDPGQFWGDFADKYNVFILMIFFLSIGMFIAIFVVPVNRKLSYIKYFSTEVRKISRQKELGLIVEIKGNDELAELGMSINAMSKELKKRFEYERKVENTKSELITNISHDLRSPLTSIIGYLELIQKHHFNNQEDLNDYIDTIYNKSQSMRKLIDELFDYTKLSSPGVVLDYQKIQLNSLLNQIIGEYTPIFEREGLIITKDFPQEDVEVYLDVEKIVRVFQNLLDNARKYSAKPSEIKATISKSPDKVRISFLNKVKIFPTQRPEELFERFAKGDSSRTEENSSGLGLAIAKKIIELHGGSIRADYFSKAIEFVIEIPMLETCS